MKPNIQALRAVGDFATMYQWSVSLIGGPVDGSGLDLRCETMEIPKATNTPVVVQIRGITVRQPGISTVSGTIELAFAETFDSYVAGVISTWERSVFDFRSGIASRKSAAEATLVMQLLDRQGAPRKTYTLRGVFLEDYDLGTMDGTSSEVQKTTLRCSYDYFDVG